MWKCWNNRALPCLVGLVLLALAGCQSPPSTEYVRDGKSYGVTPGLFNERWWNYYQRGVSFAEGGFWEEARDDYRVAIELRSRDRWRARTYGMHFIDYFPHRELGVALLQLGDPEAAVPHLERSLDSAPSSRAAHFLNEARAILSLQAGDRQPPALNLAAALPSLTNQDTLNLNGSFEDGSGVRYAWIGNTPRFIEVAPRHLPFSREVALQPGVNALVLAATDLAGNATRETREVVMDPVGPALGLQETERGWVCFARDAHGVREIRSGAEVVWQGEANEVRVELPASYHRGVPLRAEDQAGNATLLARPGERHGSLSPGERGAIRVASASNTPTKTDQSVELWLGTPPEEVYKDYVYLTIHMEAEAPIARLHVNGNDVELLSSTPVQTVHHKVDLDMGDNNIRVQMLTVSGTRREASCQVYRDLSAYDQPETKYRAALISLPGAVPVENVFFAYEIALRDRRRFNLLGRRLIPAILIEDLVDEIRKPINITPTSRPRHESAEILIGLQGYKDFQSPDADANGTTYVSWIAERDTGRSPVKVHVYVPERESAYHLRAGAILASKLMEAYPRIKGTVSRDTDGALVMDRGTQDGIVTSMKAVAIGEDNMEQHVYIPGFIEKAGKSTSVIDPEIPEEAAVLKDGDPVVTK